MHLLTPRAQNYLWGSRTLIPNLRGDQPSEQPLAELWYGAHPHSPSIVGDVADGRTLADVIAQDPQAQLGKDVVDAFGTRLPFLLKILAAGEPLSLQAHPSLEQAREGYAAENERGIALSAPNRNYKDDNHKPELLVALSEFHAMAGFRPLAQTQQLFEALSCTDLTHYTSIIDPNGKESDNLRALFTTWITIPYAPRKQLIQSVVDCARTIVQEAQQPKWILEALANVVALNDRYPGDIGVLGAMMLHYIVLQPGEAIYLDAGNLHAYVSGLGVEIMANSDNVLRGGLTTKYVDVPELVKVLKFESIDSPETPEVNGNYQVPIDEFSLTHLKVVESDPVKIGEGRPVIALCVHGSVRVGELDLSPTEAVWISAQERDIEVTGDGDLFLATV